MSLLYAAYGSNINTEQMNRRCPDAKIIGTGNVQDMQLAFNKVATLHSKSDTVSPVLLWELTEEDEKKLDVFEGYPHKYHKETVRVEADGKIITAMSYIMNDSKRQRVPTEEYYDRISKGYAQFGFDFIYLENAFDRALEYEESVQLTFDNYIEMSSGGRSNLSDDLMIQAFLVGKCCERYGLDFSHKEIKELTLFMSEDFRSGAFGTFEDYADAVLSDIAKTKDIDAQYYVAYGSNMNTEQMALRCPKSTEVGTGEIIDHQLMFCNYANIKSCSDVVTPCVIWSIDPEDWKNLDRYESYPILYRKEEVDISFDGKRETAIAYIIESSYAIPSLPQKYYLEGITQGYIEHNLDTAPLTEALNNTVRYVNSINKTGGRK